MASETTENTRDRAATAVVTTEQNWDMKKTLYIRGIGVFCVKNTYIFNIFTVCITNMLSFNNIGSRKILHNIGRSRRDAEHSNINC